MTSRSDDSLIAGNDFRSLPIAMVSVDANGLITAVHDGSSGLLGLEPNNLVGQVWLDIARATDRFSGMIVDLASLDGMTSLYLSVGAGSPSSLRAERLSRVDQEVWVLLPPSNQDLTDEQAQIRRQLYGIGNLAGSVSHRLNNDLMRILGTIDMARAALAAEDTTAVRQYIDQIEIAGRDLSAEARRLSLLGRQFGEGQKIIDAHDFLDTAILRVTASTARAIRTDFRAKHHLVSASEGLLIDAFTTLMQGALENLVASDELVVGTADATDDTNARLSEGERAARSFVEITATPTSGTFQSGITSVVFHPIFRPDRETADTSTAYVVITENGGHIAADLTQGSSRLSVWLPVDRTDEKSSQAVLTKPSVSPVGPPDIASPGKAVSAASVLVVDDDQDVAETAVALIEACGFEVMSASSGQEAIQLFGRLHQSIDLVIVDHQMPGLNGRETITALRGIDPTCKVVLSSGYTGEMLSSYEDVEGLEYLAKPYRLADLAELLERSL